MSDRRWMRLGFWLLLLALAIVALRLLSGILLPFVGGALIAYFLNPLAARLERLGLSRTLAALLVTIFFFVAFAMLIALLVPLVQADVGQFAAKLPDYVKTLTLRIGPTIKWLQSHLPRKEAGQLQQSLEAYAGNAFTWLIGVVEGLVVKGVALVNVLSLVIIMPVVTFYLLRDWKEMLAQLDLLLPRPAAATIRAQMAEIDRTLAAFLRGQGLVCLILGVYYGVGLAVVGLDFGLLAGGLTGLFTFIPYIGMTIGVILSFILALLQFDDWQHFAMMGGVFVIGSLVEGNVLTPLLVGGRIGLHPVWIIFALLAGGVLFGFVGILLAVPTAAVIGVLVRHGVRRYLESPLYLGESA